MVGVVDDADLADLRSALIDQAQSLCKSSPAAWAAAAIRRIRATGLMDDDRDLLAAWRAQRDRAAQAAAAQAAARASGPPPDPEAAARGRALLASLRQRRAAREAAC